MAKTMTVDEVKLLMAKMLLTAEGSRGAAMLVCEKVIDTYEKQIHLNLTIAEIQENQTHINNWKGVIDKIKWLTPSKSDKV